MEADISEMKTPNSKSPFKSGRYLNDYLFKYEMIIYLFIQATFLLIQSPICT